MNFFKLSISVLLAIFFINSSFAQKAYHKKPPFLKGTIVFEDNVKSKGLIRVPKAPSDNYVFFKTDEDSKAEKYKIDLIKYFEIESESGTEYHFDILPIKILERDISKKQAVMLRKSEGYVSVYYLGNTYKVRKNDGEIAILYIYNSGTDFPTFNYYVKKKDEDFAHFIVMLSRSSMSKAMKERIKNNIVKVLPENKKLVKRIQNDEFTNEDYEKIFVLYNDYMKGH